MHITKLSLKKEKRNENELSRDYNIKRFYSISDFIIDIETIRSFDNLQNKYFNLSNLYIIVMITFLIRMVEI